jgi:hypothetical protein
MGKALIAVAIFVVFVILCLGLYTMMKGGTTSASYSNKLMRLRVIAQFIAILLIMAVLFFSQSGQH